ncbi:diguanylate phosphodiesterase [Halomonas sp. A020]|uniref:EAL domain-containing protein n=1 Tax=unclassified Halomonas TaxID=2609666 RepID=UPI00209DDEC6|nr:MULTISPECIES: EAL domain-containing protein [unclassified Halomonas]MCP1318292.1 EAL domain-containing protein [Halomonas sp. 707B3]BCB61115.1 diguanylate phosphodiesterase [Halomonas sp. A020]
MVNCDGTEGQCPHCSGGIPFEFSMAFQPIVDVAQREIYAYEALVRGVNDESAFFILNQVTDELIYRFDQACRVKAIELASRLGMDKPLSINFLPNAVYEPEACIKSTLEVSERVGWPVDQLIFEITETEKVRDRQHIKNIIDAYKEMGFTVALDDFGSGYANLDLLTTLSPNKLKIDRELVMNCDHDPRRQTLLITLVSLGRRLNMTLIAEGVETVTEARWLMDAGISLQQGFYYARPTFEHVVRDLQDAFDAVHRTSSTHMAPIHDFDSF